MGETSTTTWEDECVTQLPAHIVPTSFPFWAAEFTLSNSSVTLFSSLTPGRCQRCHRGSTELVDFVPENKNMDSYWKIWINTGTFRNLDNKNNVKLKKKKQEPKGPKWYFDFFPPQFVGPKLKYWSIPIFDKVLKEFDQHFSLLWNKFLLFSFP